jgi:hypothetical protein
MRIFIGHGARSPTPDATNAATADADASGQYGRRYGTTRR